MRFVTLLNTALQTNAKSRQIQARKKMVASGSSLQTSDSALNDGFGKFMRNLEEKSSEEIDRNYFCRQKGVVLRKYLVPHGVQTSDLGKAYNKE